MNFDYHGIFGSDISRWQDDPTTPTKNNFNKMKNYGMQFCIPKCGQYNFIDRDFIHNWNGAKNAGLGRGSYWFCDYRSTGKVQAQLYWGTLEQNGYNGELCFADYETGSWTNWKELYNFIYEFQRISGVPDDKIGIYTGYYYCMEHSPNFVHEKQWLSKYHLWLAYYTNSPRYVRVPNDVWKDEQVLIWQSGTPAIGHDCGVESREIDYDQFQGDINKFEKYFGTSIPNNKTEVKLNYSNGSILYKEV